MFIEILVTMVIILILNFGVDLGPNAIWILAGVGIGAFLVTHWISTRFSEAITGGASGMGGDGRIAEDTPLGKWISRIIVTVCFCGAALGIYWWFTYQPPPQEERVSLMNGNYPLPKDLKISGKQIIIEGDNSIYPVACTEQEVQRILQHAFALPKEDDQKQWASHYYTIGMRYYTYAKEGTQGWDRNACYAFARNNFTISSRLPSDGTIRIESQTALLDCIHELIPPKY